MGTAPFVILFFFSHLLPPLFAKPHNCSSFVCGNLGSIRFPFRKINDDPECGLLTVTCSQPDQRIQLVEQGKWYQVMNISQDDTIFINDVELQQRLKNNKCDVFENLKLPTSLKINLIIEPNMTFFKCNRTLHSALHTRFEHTCGAYDIKYDDVPYNFRKEVPPQCSVIQLPMAKQNKNYSDPFSLLAHEFYLKAQLSWDCIDCRHQGGQCKYDSKGRVRCVGKGKSILKLAAGIGSATIFILIVCSILYIVWRRYRQKYASSDFIFTNPPDPSTKSGPGDCFYFGVPVFTYSELQEATYNFDPARELGDGGFGTVYHGKLRDGREVAVKRLYEKSYKRVEQFMNEIEILTRLRHQNLVTLYGCTSRYSRELLLVYEFIPKGTVADHLHGDQATPSSLPWPVRLRIAIETASALAYLHASDIIHRDVKTNNILLDNNFGVKVADFGLSRLFPNDVTHVSTAPQGTPGYVDPEYHQCYQLTEKSDVYSFGVVLIELISSMPAVDIFRQNHEINLANLAVNKIQNQAFGELVDPCLGFESDLAVRRMTISAAELAFQCLQLDREARPSMVEVLKVLMIIESEQGNVEKTEDAHDTAGAPLPVVPPPASPESDNVVLLKRMHLPTSPGTVMEKWASRSTTTTASG
ncbi:LEAF RUST 10 DISEASE-RESISTANCE LOCUS RECEPTOR-LIKE PROTEIN KINASE-like 1.1 isoform X3 [Malania oleifera]|uniref:LEAF RUST 10 DISEASE-RESISTANCE LOCUS RECEPTOR-LIKE PROTEIN KINASE-like 1.1 isoform X3 n=1 Tax=Malania oleifera TaxID=397392 RepID=UPI0025ADDBD7|nr:LEAF RUST 10 DISEASE-RESISTANCE LOCUS RECEPTOR-LIKE PROTEIN KINASE-like 1.1 isoform X3 [Malania oleifera]